MSQTSVRQEITQAIINALEHDIIPWRRPWSVSKNVGNPANIVSGKNYRGINPLVLDLHAGRHGFQSRWWGTFHQFAALGGSVTRRPDDVPPGRWGAKIVYFAPVKKTVVNKDTGEQEEDQFLVLKTYSVFNVDQVAGGDLDEYRADKEPAGRPEWADFGPAEELLNATGARIEHGGDRAFYRRPEPFEAWPNHTHGDDIVLPQKGRFFSEADYYTTALHELAHFAEVRTGWDFRVRGYEMGELAAEMAACFVAGELGLPQGDLANHGRYVKHWIEAMKGDTSYVFQASSQASKVTDYLLGFVQKDQVGAGREDGPAAA